MTTITAGTIEARNIRKVFVDGVEPPCPVFGTAVVHALNVEEGWVEIYDDDGIYGKRRLYGKITYTLDES